MQICTCTCKCLCSVCIWYYYNNICLGVHKHKPVGAESQWQRPEISSNLAEDLSLDDPIDPTLLPQQKDKRSKRWKDAHSKKGEGEREREKGMEKGGREREGKR